MITENWVIHDVIEDYIGQEVSTTIFIVERVHSGIASSTNLVTSFLIEEKAKEFIDRANSWCLENKVGGATLAGSPVYSTSPGDPLYSGNFVGYHIGSGNLFGGIRSGSGPLGPPLSSGTPYYAPTPDPREKLVCPHDPGFRWYLGMNVHYAYKFVELRF